MVRNRVGVVCVTWCLCMGVMLLSVYIFVEEGTFTCCSTCVEVKVKNLQRLSRLVFEAGFLLDSGVH